MKQCYSNNPPFAAMQRLIRTLNCWITCRSLMRRFRMVPFFFHFLKTASMVLRLTLMLKCSLRLLLVAVVDPVLTISSAAKTRCSVVNQRPILISRSVSGPFSGLYLCRRYVGIKDTKDIIDTWNKNIQVWAIK